MIDTAAVKNLRTELAVEHEMLARRKRVMQVLTLKRELGQYRYVANVVAIDRGMI